jgi:uncharacterized protein YndB with AHSA1/START domain
MSRAIAFAPVRKTVRVKAPLSRSFELFTAISWWPKQHSILKGTRQQAVLIELNGNFQVDPDLVTEVEITFIAEGAALTRVELEHRYLERAGDTAAALRAGIDSPDGWAGLLKRFAETAGGAAP